MRVIIRWGGVISGFSGVFVRRRSLAGRCRIGWRWWAGTAGGGGAVGVIFRSLALIFR